MRMSVALPNTTSPKFPKPGGEWWKVSIILVVMALCVWVLSFPQPAQARPAWHYTQASYYTQTGNSTACGTHMVDKTSWHVAMLGGTKSSCGRKLTICNHSRCVNVSVLDTGGAHRGRLWDLTPRVKAALRCGDLCDVKWRDGS